MNLPMDRAAGGIDDDYELGEGDDMPDAFWHLSDLITVQIRIRTSRIPTAPLLAFANEFYRVTDVLGARYLSLWRYTDHNAYLPHPTPGGEVFDRLVAAHPDTFTTVIGGAGPSAVWLALRLTCLSDPVAETLRQVCTTALF